MTATEEKNTTGNSGGSGAEANPTPSPSWRGFRRFVRGRFDLSEDKASESEVIENIRKGIEFKGTNLWVLVFATFIASLGLNVNSTAVIIGAMLISPLMGPIMGIGLSVGINDFELMKRSLRNFGFMVLVSIATSTFYFVISPLSNAQSELLARTVPTTYDVLIALFGGLAGIVAQSRKDRTSTVIPGVAIATALMPPLCTAGFGLATLQLKYFIGAFYLFFINTVFIAIATYMVVRFLKYEKHSFLDSKKERKVRRSMVLIVLVTLIPSVVIGYRIVKRSVFEANADRYVATVMKFPQAQDFFCQIVVVRAAFRPVDQLLQLYRCGTGRRTCIGGCDRQRPAANVRLWAARHRIDRAPGGRARYGRSLDAFVGLPRPAVGEEPAYRRTSATGFYTEERFVACP